jgi:hypothetical protein
MQDRTRRALAALAEIDACQLYLCPTCEGLLLTAAAGAADVMLQFYSATAPPNVSAVDTP